MKIVFIAYNSLPQYHSPEEWLGRIPFFTGIMEELAKSSQVAYIGQINYDGGLKQNGVSYRFLRSNRMGSRFPLRLHIAVENMKPDIVVIPGFHFPLQVMQLKRHLGKKVKIIAEHHADKPYRGIKKILQKWADSRVDAYHFTSLGNARPWLDAGIIRDRSKCREVPAGSTGFRQQDKISCKKMIGMTEGPNFIWVGRLNANKDPITILQAFERYLEVKSSAKLFMIYQEDNLLPEIKILLGRNPALREAVVLQGPVPNKELETWLSAADYFISGSHTEGGSIALLEAMACGCIPVVTAIPSALEATGSGKFGLHFQAGNSNELYEKLLSLQDLAQAELSIAVRRHFGEEFSFEAIARKFYHSCELLYAK